MKRVVAALIVVLILSSIGTPDGTDKEQATFSYARIRYHFPPYSRFRELPWHHDYPFGDELFSTFVAKSTNVNTTRESFVIVDIDSKELFKYPFAYLCEPGYLNLLPEDVINLREYLDRGGFILVDDFRGARDLEVLRVELKKVYPDRDLVRLDITHPIFHSFFDIDTLNIPPPYGFEPVDFLALLDPKGNVQMIVNHNNDLSELWEWVDRGEMPLHDGVTSLQLGTNYLIYSMTH